jgi:very-short-patch-repair endonuclease
MSLTEAEAGRIYDRLRGDLEEVMEYQVSAYIKEFSAVCESPIEVMFGAAFIFSMNAIMPAIGRRCLAYLFDENRKLEPVVLGQWKLVPQHKWEKYRIDFALFTALPYPIFVECDGHDFHERTKEQAARDREKDRSIQAAGIPILRFTGSEIYASAQDCAFQLYRFASGRMQEIEKKKMGELA